MSRNLRPLLVIVAILVTSVVLIVTGDLGAPDKDDRSDVVLIEENDPEMNAAIDRARSTVGGFVDRLPMLRSHGAYYSVKFALTEFGTTEYLWIAAPAVDGDAFSGTLESDPASLPGWSYGDRVSVPMDQISDWMAIMDGTLYGGFTLYALDRHMSPAERRSLHEALGMPLPDAPVVWD